MRLRFPLVSLVVCFFASLALGPAVAAAEEVIPLSPPATSVSLQQSGDGSEVLTVTVSEVRLDAVEIDGLQWAVVRVPSGHGLMVRGEPALPFLATEYLLDRTGGIALELISTTTRDIDLTVRGYAGVAPSRGHFNRNIDPDTVPYEFSSRIYGAAVSYPAESAWVDDPFIAGPLRGQSARIPVAAWRSDDNLLTVVEEARFRVVHTAAAPNPRLRPEPPLTGLFDQLARQRMVNYDLVRGRYTPFVETGRLLILSYDDFVDEAQPLADWQRQVGYPTLLVPLSSVGTTASQVMSYIQSLYNQPEGLTWIILVGDAQQVPFLLGVMEGAPCDPCYTKLEGSDNRPDAAISRISAQSGAQVTVQVDKILEYERFPDQGSAATWYPKAFGIGGDDYGGGAYDWERVDWLRVDLVEPAYVYTEFTQLYHNPSKAQVAAAVNDGRSLGLYIGHGGEDYWVTSGFSVNDVNTMLSNGEMLPVIWSVACVNGKFNWSGGDCFAESWLKKSGGGAVSFEAGTTNESWVPPCDAQRGIIDSLRLETAFTTGGEHVNGKLYGMDVNGDGNYDEGTKFMEQSTLFGSCTTWMRTLPPQIPDEPVDFSSGGGVASLTVTVGGLPLAKANAAIVSFYTEDGGLTPVGSGLIDAAGMVHATVTGEPTHCHIHGQNLVPQSFELAARPDGRISLDAEAYACNGTVTVRVSDSNVPGSSPATIDTLQVTLAIPGDSATVTLTETAADRSLYAGTAVLGTDLTGGGHGDPLTATYLDADDGAGGSNVVKTDTALLDCAGPAIDNVNIEATNAALTVRFATDEPGTTVVRYGTTRPPTMVVSDTALATEHEIVIDGVDPCTDYWIGVESADALGNVGVDTNGGSYYAIETMGWQVFLSEPFDADPGWTIDNGGNSHGWAFGQPTGGGGQYGEPDPTSGHTGTNVYGVNLVGDYDPNLTADQLKLTTPSLDLSEATSVMLRYWRWLGVESPSYDHARVQVSVDGGAFVTVWENADRIDGGSWVEEVVDVTAQAAGHADVRIRWTMGVTDYGWQYAGWNLDDVVIEGAFPCDGSPMPFVDGFESGDCSAWSLMVQ